MQQNNDIKSHYNYYQRFTLIPKFGDLNNLYNILLNNAT